MEARTVLLTAISLITILGLAAPNPSIFNQPKHFECRVNSINKVGLYQNVMLIIVRYSKKELLKKVQTKDAGTSLVLKWIIANHLFGNQSLNFIQVDLYQLGAKDHRGLYR